MIRSLLCLVFSVFFLVSATAENLELKILFTADTHAVFHGSNGGWLKLAPLIKQESADRTNTLLIDCGDTLQGSIEGAFDRGKAVIKTMNHLKFDFWAIGNHDIEFGFPTLRERIKEFNGFAAAGNLVIPDNAPQLPTMKTFERRGVKIAVIGLTLPDMHDDIRISSAFAGKSSGIIENLRSIITTVRATKPDIIILAMHCDKYRAGFSIYDIPRNFPEIDLILGAHSHQSFPGERINSTWYAQTAAYATELGKVSIIFDNKKRRIVRINSELLPVHPDTAPDSELKLLLKNDFKAVNSFKHRNIGRAQSPIAGFDPKRRFNNPAGLLMAKAMINSTGAELALLSMNSKYELRDKISELDVFRLMPYENTVAVIKVTPMELKTILKEQIVKSSDYYSPVFYGLNVEFKRKNSSLEIYDHNFKLISDDAKFTLALTNYLMISRRFPELQKIAAKHPLPKPPQEPLLRDCMRDWIKKNSPISPDTEEWLIIKN